VFHKLNILRRCEGPPKLCLCWHRQSYCQK